ncbi:hypothetical protein Trydic_g18173 [Trypoxylus dichotomus]
MKVDFVSQTRGTSTQVAFSGGGKYSSGTEIVLPLDNPSLRWNHRFFMRALYVREREKKRSEGGEATGVREGSPNYTGPCREFQWV